MDGRRRARERGTRPRGERGAAAVEFALVVPLFVALVFGILSYGWMLSYRQGISQAAAEGARSMAVAPSGNPTALTDARAAVNRALASYGVECTSTGTLTHGGRVVGTCTLVLNESCAGTVNQHCARVSITHAYRDNPLIPSFPGLGITLPQQLSYQTTAEISS